MLQVYPRHLEQKKKKKTQTEHFPTQYKILYRAIFKFSTCGPINSELAIAKEKKCKENFKKKKNPTRKTR